MLPPPSRSRKRKIPGPIGELERGTEESLANEATQNEESMISWRSEAWLAASSVFGDGTAGTSSLRDLMTRYLEVERSGTTLVCIETIHHHSDKDATVSLADPTGRVQGYLHRLVVEEYGPVLTAGAVILVRNAVVICSRVEIGSWYLNITPDNVGALWPVSARYVAQDQSAPNLFKLLAKRQQLSGLGDASAENNAPPGTAQIEAKGLKEFIAINVLNRGSISDALVCQDRGEVTLMNGGLMGKLVTNPR